MPPGTGGAQHACAEQDHPLATDRRVCDEDAPPLSHSHSPSPFPASEAASETKKMRKDELEPQPLGSLPEGPLVEILSPVPYRSLCRFKCVSKPWLALCSNPEIRRSSPQTLSGFFYQDGGRFKENNRFELCLLHLQWKSRTVLFSILEQKPTILLLLIDRHLLGALQLDGFGSCRV